MKSTLKIAIVWFFLTLAIYALLLWLLPDVQIWPFSYGYHIVLLALPLVLLAIKWESAQSLGFVKGKWQFGLLASFTIIIITLAVYWLMNNRQFGSPTIGYQLISTVSWVPMAEELSLRGYIQPKLEARCGKWPGLVLTALLFSVLHLPKIFLRQASPPVLLVVAFIFGIVFGFIRDKTNSIYYPVLCHGAINLIVFFTSGS